MLQNQNKICDGNILYLLLSDQATWSFINLGLPDFFFSCGEKNSKWEAEKFGLSLLSFVTK